MKIKNKDLQNLYKAYIMENIPLSRKKCPPAIDIIKFFRKKTPGKQKTKILDHITNCFYCAQEFEFILQTLRFERKLNEEISNVFQSQRNRTAFIKRSEKKVSNRKKRQNLYSPVLSWKYSALLAGIIIIISALIIYQKSVKRELRGSNFNRVHLIEPINNNYSRSLLIFKWNEVKNSEYYILELYDETLFLIWKSKKNFKTQILLPNDLAKRLTKNKTYFWMVTAFLPEGKKFESDIEGFILTD